MEPDRTPHQLLAENHEHYLATLCHLGTSELGLTPDDARALALEVLTVAQGSRHLGPNVLTWLTATMTSAARGHRRTDGETV